MEKYDVLILGGSAAGLACANASYARNPEKSIQVVRNVDYTVIPCGIPYIYGILNSVEKDQLPDQGFLNRGIKIKQGNVIDVDRNKQIVKFENGEPVQYDKLIMALGSNPKSLPIEGIDLANVFTIKKDPAHLQGIFEVLDSVKDLVVIGGGFIGVEVAEQIKMRGDCNVSLIEALPYCLMLTCEEFQGLKIEDEMRKMGIKVINNTTVKSINGSGKVESVLLSDGSVLKADMVVLGIGSAPNIELAEKIGLDVEPGGGIKVDEYMSTSDPKIFACGDCCTKFSAIDGTPSDTRLASVAALEGLIAGSNLISKQRKNRGMVGAFCTKVGDISVASAGYTEKKCQEKGMEYYTGSIIAPDRHPGSLPGCTPDMEMKLIFERGSDRVIGAHIAGGVQAGDMANIIAVAIQNRLTAEQIITSQFATHPLLTGSPLVYHVLWASENAILGRD